MITVNVLYTASMDKTKIRAELDKLGVVYNARLGEEKLMEILVEARKKGSEVAPEAETPEVAAVDAAGPEAEPAPAPEAAPAAEEAAPVEEEAPAPGAFGLVKIKDKFGFTVRTFSKEEHGDDFIELAQSFAQKKGLRIA